MPEFLTTREVADLLRIKERKVYELVSEGVIPASRVTGKLLFPRDLVEAWVRRQIDYRGLEPPPAMRPRVIAGSHDPLLEWAIRECGGDIATLFDGSLDGLKRMVRGECIAAAMHVFEPSSPDDKSDDRAGGWNVQHVRDRLHGEPVVLLEWVYRLQGLIVAPGNPLSIKSVADLRGRRFAPRQREAGARVLFEHLLAQAELDEADIGWLEPPARSESDVALCIAQGKADAGLAIEAVARQQRMDFVPLVKERFDLLVWRRDAFEPALQKLLTFARSDAFAQRASELGGYELNNVGGVIFNSPAP